VLHGARKVQPAVRESPQYAPAPCDLDLKTGVRVTCDVGTFTSVSILVFLGLSVLDLGPLYATDIRQTASLLNAPA